MITQNKAKRDTVKLLNDYFNQARNSFIWREYRKKCDINYPQYFGDQWTEELRSQLKTINATPYCFNIIKPSVNTYISLQIDSRKRVTFKPTTNIPRHREITDQIKNFIYNIQTQNDSASQDTLKCRDALIGGIGWSHFCYEENGWNTFHDEYVDYREVLWDPEDLSYRLDKSNFVIRAYYVSSIALIQRYPEFTGFFNDLTSDKTIGSVYSFDDSEKFDHQSNLWIKGKSIRIVEVYYRKNASFYESTVGFYNPNPQEEVQDIEQYFYTFDEELAKNRSVKGTKPKKMDGTKIFKGVFCQDVLLENGPVNAQVPNQKYMPLLPLCLERDYKGVPVGKVESLIEVSQARNYLASKTIHSIGSKFLIIEGDPTMDLAKTSPHLMEQMSQKRGAIALRSAKDAQFFNSETILPYLFQGMKWLDGVVEQDTQLYDELKGDESNANSGIAIQQRTINSARGQNILNAAYDYMLKSKGQLMLDTIKGIKDFKYAFSYYPENTDEIKFGVLDNEISTLNFDIHTDIAPNFLTSREEEMEMFKQLMQNPSAAAILSSVIYLMEWGFSEAKAKSLNEAFLNQNEAQNNEEAINQQALAQGAGIGI